MSSIRNFVQAPDRSVSSLPPRLPRESGPLPATRQRPVGANDAADWRRGESETSHGQGDRGRNGAARTDPPQDERVPTSSGRNEESDRPKGPFSSVHIYGGKGALCFSADETRGGEATVRLEGATSTGPKVYDWKSKVILQFTPRELPFVLAVLMGWLPSYRVSAHGANNDKGASLENQDGGKVYVKVWHGQNSRAVPVMPPDLVPVIDLVMGQLRAQYPQLAGQALLTVIASLAKRQLPT